MSNILAWLQTRLQERSTLLGLTGFLTVAGIHISTDTQDLILQIGAVVASIIAIFTKDKTPTVSK